MIATDIEWVGGNGAARINGLAIDLLLVVTGRRAGLAGLSGSGVERLINVLK